MKCDHIRTRAQGDTPFFPNMLNNGNVEVCLKEDVDAAIAELKQAMHDAEMAKDLAEAANTEYRLDIEKIKAENERLKATPEEIMKEVFDKVLIYPPDMVRLQDAYCLAVSLRKAKRALWLARAYRAEASKNYWMPLPSAPKED